MRNHLLAGFGLAVVLMLSGCDGGGGSGGGNGGGVPTPAPAPIPTPVVSPTKPEPAPVVIPTMPEPEPTPVPVPTPSLHSAEYSNSSTVAGSKAQYAYGRGYTGKDVTIAIIDSGIDLDNPEFAGRISNDSTSFAATFARCKTCPNETVTYDLDDVQGHGTWVASVAAGAMNDIGSHGVAYDATILALKTAAPPTGNLPAEGTPAESGMNSGAIAPAIRYAVDHGAFVVNISANGRGEPNELADLRAAMNEVAAQNALVVQSVSNQFGNSFTNTLTEQLVGTDLANADWFLFGLRVGSDLQPILGNGTPGALAHRTLAVAGADHVLVTSPNGGTRYVNGNSFAAPTIAGAAALLKQYWPQLGGKEISGILLATATDLGPAGVDQQFGAGLLNIEAAFKADEPQLGASSATMSPVESTSLIVSPAFGGIDGGAAFSAVAGHPVVIDKWGRDYRVNIGTLVGGMRPNGISLARLMQTDSTIGLTRSEHGLDGEIWGAENTSIESSDLITGSLLETSGLATYGSSVNLQGNGYRYSFGAAQSDTADAISDTVRFGAELPGGLLIGYTNSREVGSALGTRGVGAFQIEGANSNFLSLGYTGDLAGFNLSGEVILGRTKVKTRNALIEFNDAVISSGFRFRAEREAFGGIMLFGLTSPLKVEHAELNYTAPYAFDPESETFLNRTTRIDLSPSARELNLEAGWSRFFGRSYLALNGAYRFNSGNVQGERSAAAWLRFGTAF